MELKNYEELINRVKAGKKHFTMAVSAAGDAHTLEAVMMARRAGLVSPTLVGDRDAIVTALSDLGETVAMTDIVDAKDAAESAAKSVELVRQGKADFIMKGKLDTSVLLKAVVNKESGLSTGNLMSIFLLAEIPGYHKLIAVVDGGMVPYPTLEQKKGIIENTVSTLHRLGCPCPKVGVLACIEKVNPKMPETVDAAALTQMNQTGEIARCIVEGPISYDCAMSREISDMKGYESRISGDCDALIAPNIHTANIMTKMLVVTCHAKTAGFIVGAKCPIVMSSRGSSAEEKLRSILLAAAATKG